MFALAIRCGLITVYPQFSEFRRDSIREQIDESILLALLTIGLFAPLYEEIVYRVLPYISISALFFIFESTGFWKWIGISIAVLSTLTWILEHSVHALVIAPLGIFYGSMLWNGLLVESFVIHSLYNSTIVIVSKI